MAFWFALNSLIQALKDSAEAFVDRLSKEFRIVCFCHRMRALFHLAEKGPQRQNRRIRTISYVSVKEGSDLKSHPCTENVPYPASTPYLCWKLSVGFYFIT
jgi:hypothetical protein